MKIEVGKYYECRDGGIVKIVEDHGSGDERFEGKRLSGSGGWFWDACGKIHGSVGERLDDLVRELTFAGDLEEGEIGEIVDGTWHHYAGHVVKIYGGTLVQVERPSTTWGTISSPDDDTGTEILCLVRRVPGARLEVVKEDRPAWLDDPRYEAVGVYDAGAVRRAAEGDHRAIRGAFRWWTTPQQNGDLNGYWAARHGGREPLSAADLDWLRGLADHAERNAVVEARVEVRWDGGEQATWRVEANGRAWAGERAHVSSAKMNARTRCWELAKELGRPVQVVGGERFEP